MSQEKRLHRPNMRPGRGHFGPRMMLPMEKPKDFKGTFTRLIGYLLPHKVLFIAVFLMAGLGTLFSILSPKIMGKAITKLFEGMMMKFRGVPGGSIDFDYVSKILLILAGLYVISAFFNYIQQYLMAGISQKIVFNMRKDINDKLSCLPLKFFDTHAYGDILSRVTNDVDNISNTLQQSITQLVTSAITLFGIIIMMLTISPLLTLISVVTLPPYIIATKLIAARSQKYFLAQQKALGELNGHVEEMFTGHKIIKAFGREGESISKFNEINEKLYDSGWKAQFISGVIMPLMGFFNNIGYVIICVVGGVFVAKNRIEIGDVQAFIQYSRQFTQPIIQAANIANILQATIASAERVFELLDEAEEVSMEQFIAKQAPEGKLPSEKISSEKLPVEEIYRDEIQVRDIQPEEITHQKYVKALEHVRGDVEFHNVSFGYDEGVTVIDNLSLNVKHGQTVAIVGPTGAGKTTLVNLLMRFYEINSGKITIDGVDIRTIERGELRSIFGMVLQDTWLFNGTIRDNIAYGRENVAEKEIINAARIARADHFIRTLPDGYDTVLNEEASNISQGQRQLLTIARAILANPAILILDEATSNVDTRTEVHIQQAMIELMKGRTNFVIAHRLSTIRGADMILVMNNGRIIEKGTHEELLQKGGFYTDLYNSQFTGSYTDNQAS